MSSYANIKYKPNASLRDAHIQEMPQSPQPNIEISKILTSSQNFFLLLFQPS